MVSISPCSTVIWLSVVSTCRAACSTIRLVYVAPWLIGFLTRGTGERSADIGNAFPSLFALCSLELSVPPPQRFVNGKVYGFSPPRLVVTGNGTLL